MDAEKVFNKIQYPFLIKSDETRSGMNVPQHTKDYFRQAYR
jgi:hypothetical protein